MWKKRKEIEGVSMGPLIALKASVFERQFTEKQMKASAEKKPKVTKPLKDGLGKANPGLDERNKRDLEQLKKEADTKNVDLRLKEKAELYEKMQAGEVMPNEQDEEKGPLVDFLRKTYNDLQKKKQSEQQRRDDDSDSSRSSTSSRRRAGRDRDRYRSDSDDRELISGDQRMSRERERWERQQEEQRREEEMEELQKEQQIQLIEQIRDQTNKSRQRHQQQKARRQELMDKRLERIKERLANQQQQTPSTKAAEEESSDDSEEEAEEEEKQVAARPQLYDPFDETEEVLAELEAKKKDVPDKGK